MCYTTNIDLLTMSQMSIQLPPNKPFVVAVAVALQGVGRKLQTYVPHNKHRLVDYESNEYTVTT